MAEPNKGNSETATIATAGTAPVGLVASGVAELMMGVASTTTAAGVTAVVEAGVARRMLVVAQGATEGAPLVATTETGLQLWRRNGARRRSAWGGSSTSSRSSSASSTDHGEVTVPEGNG